MKSQTANRYGIQIGNEISIKTIQGTKEKFFTLQVVGLTDGQQYSFAPSMFIPFKTWDQIRPQALRAGTPVELISNIVIVKLKNPEEIKTVSERILNQVDGVEVVEKETA